MHGSVSLSISTGVSQARNVDGKSGAIRVFPEAAPADVFTCLLSSDTSV
jgi:hypothetical protein